MNLRKDIIKINILVLICLLTDFIFPSWYTINHGLEFMAITMLLSLTIGLIFPIEKKKTNAKD